MVVLCRLLGIRAFLREAAYFKGVTTPGVLGPEEACR